MCIRWKIRYHIWKLLMLLQCSALIQLVLLKWTFVSTKKKINRVQNRPNKNTLNNRKIFKLHSEMIFFVENEVLDWKMERATKIESISFIPPNHMHNPTPCKWENSSLYLMKFTLVHPFFSFWFLLSGHQFYTFQIWD